MKMDNQSGYIMAIALLVFLGIITIGMGLVSRSSSLLTMQENAKRKIQSFYASDGQMTLLAQELIDGNAFKYRSKNFLIYDAFGRADSDILDSGWVEIEPDNQNIVEIMAQRMIFTSDANEGIRPMVKKTFPGQTSDTLILQFTMQWKRNDQDYSTFAFYVQLGDNMSDDDAWDNVIVNLRWGDNNVTGYSDDEMFGYITSNHSGPEGKGIKKVTEKAHIKVIVYFNRRQYDILIDGKEEASKVPFFDGNNTSGEINQMRIFLDNLNTAKISGCTIDNITLLKKSADSYSSNDESNYGDFGVSYDVIEERIGKYMLSTQSYRKDAPTLNKYRTPLFQSLETDAGAAPDYPDELDVPVRFYDFHSDQSNIEFEQPIKGGSLAYKGMVRTSLDSDGKPVLSIDTTKHLLNTYIQYWFRETNPTDNTLLRVYENTREPNDWTSKNPKTTFEIIRKPLDPLNRYRAVKDAFENIVIDTILTFTHTSDGVYTFRRDDSNGGFYPLDNQGFGREPTFDKNPDESGDATDNHNYSFTMEMTRPFVKVSGQYFKFLGDDDVWVFINDSLVLDIGGKHGAVADSFFVDDLTNLEYNTAYTMKLFYCERHTTASNIFITTNMVFSQPSASSSRMWGRNYGNID